VELAGGKPEAAGMGWVVAHDYLPLNPQPYCHICDQKDGGNKKTSSI
jgi:hypothetical protein